MALTRHLLLILLLLVALHARAARAAPWRPRGAVLQRGLCLCVRELSLYESPQEPYIGPSAPRGTLHMARKEFVESCRPPPLSAPHVVTRAPCRACICLRQKWIPACRGNDSHLCLLLDEAGGSGYPASRLDVGLEPLGHPRDPFKVDGFPSVPVPEPESSPTAVPVGEGDAASRPGPGTEPAGDGVDVPAGRAFPAPRPRPAPQSGWRRRGPAREKNPAEGGKKSPAPSDNVKKTLEELERGHGTDREAAQETAFPKGSSGSLPASAAETEATRAPGTPVISKPRREKTSRADSGVVRKRTVTVSPLQSITGVFCPRDTQTFCMLSAVALAVSVAAALLLGCTWVRRWWRRKKRASAASGQQLETGGLPSHPRSRTSRPGTPESQQPLQMPGSPACSPSSESLSFTPPSSPSPAAVTSYDSPSTSPSSLSPGPPCHFSPSLAVVTPYNPSNTSSSPPPSRSPSPFQVAVMVHPPPSNLQPLQPSRPRRSKVRRSGRD
ncbi:uncharacterized protein LOC141947550 [Strix uralensis]|uniref:uncharacterized protein LOC141947550 n=1 Tax=Strix uralensis TaxID=36305 RepID=UPI003DA3E620